MTNNDKARSLAADINEIESRLANMNSTADDAFRAQFDPALVADLEAKHQRAGRAIAGLHRAFDKAVKNSGGVVSPRAGGK